MTEQELNKRIAEILESTKNEAGYGRHTGRQYRRIQRIKHSDHLLFLIQHSRYAPNISHLKTGSSIIHKVYGSGIIVSLDGPSVSVQFATQLEPKKFMLFSSLGGGFLKTGTDDDILIQANAKLLQMDGSIERRLKSAEAALEPYQKYL